eukprot:TRINITY_DN6756_c0_g1_i1.p1 TRINITY_DN6756_c0_g1~~TRINITY_DN6756_c0_g1_i1.p1  ORF type:complete len:147 (-),score=43.54 TRINITY_DN6756_c0_g1_i1:25-465(-)
MSAKKQQPKRSAAKQSPSQQPKQPIEEPINASRWAALYPVYFSLKSKVSEGRRVPLTKAVDNPTLNDLAECIKQLGLQHKEEPDKKYPRDFTLVGRIRIKLKDDAGKPINPNIPTKVKLLKAVADLLPKVKSNKALSNTGSKKKKK